MSNQDTKTSFNRQDYQEIADKDPKLAWALIQGQARQLQVFSGRCLIEDGSVGKPIPVTFEQIPDQIYVVDFMMSVDSPNGYAGSLWRAQQVNGNSQMPGIEGRLQVSQGWGASNYIIADHYVPIEHLARSPFVDGSGCCSWTNGWTILSWQSVQMTIQLSRPYQPIELPAQVRFTMRTVYLGPRFMNVGVADAISGLGDLGFDTKLANLSLAAQLREARGGF